MVDNRCELMNFQTSAANYGLGLLGQEAGNMQSGLLQQSLGCVYHYPYQDNNHYHYYQLGGFTTYIEKESKMDKAFKIIKSLMDKKIIRDDISVKEFMDICEVISKEV